MARIIAVVSSLILWASSALSAELVMVEQHGCHYCEQWDAEIAEIYPKTEAGVTAPLRRVNLRRLPDDIEFKSRPVFTPTFVLIENGKELARMEGYAGDEFFWFLLEKMLAENLDTKASKS